MMVLLRIGPTAGVILAVAAVVVGCVKADGAAPAGATDQGIAQAGATPGEKRADDGGSGGVTPGGYGRGALAGLPVARLTFVNPDGSSTVFAAEVASTEVQHATGLMYRESLAADAAMLFVFGDDAVRSFYMKNTLVPLDMIFVGADGVVAGVVENARPLTLDSRGVDAPTRFVVEINAWEAGRRGIRAGSVMSVSPPSVLSF